jgi:hypothetical protein
VDGSLLSEVAVKTSEEMVRLQLRAVTDILGCMAALAVPVGFELPIQCVVHSLELL